MAKILYFNIPATGHINPTLPVIRTLVQRGEQVIAYNHSSVQSKIAATGAEFRPYTVETDLGTLMERAGAGNFARNALMLLEIGEQLLPAILSDIERERPDLIITDSLASWGRMAARKTEVPLLAFITTFVVSREALPPMPPGAVAKFLWDAAREMPAWIRTTRRFEQRAGVRVGALPDMLMTMGDHNIVFTAREFQPNGAAFGPTFDFVGASIADRGDQLDFTPDGRPLVYVSLGTINNRNTAFYRMCFEALHDLNAQIVLSVGQHTPIESLGTIPANFVVRNFVAQLEVLKRARLFVTHGGLNSVHEGLYYGVPLVVLPQQMEQAVVAQQVVRQGAGIALGMQPPYGSTTVTMLRAAVEQGLALPREAAQRLGESLRAAGGPERAADVIQSRIALHAAQPVQSTKS